MGKGGHPGSGVAGCGCVRCSATAPLLHAPCSHHACSRRQSAQPCVCTSLWTSLYHVLLSPLSCWHSRHGILIYRYELVAWQQQQQPAACSQQARGKMPYSCRASINTRTYGCTGPLVPYSVQLCLLKMLD
eukprot:COSAG01_NODE_127_length_24940_cov_140.519923_19_plen_131_part_00